MRMILCLPALAFVAGCSSYAETNETVRPGVNTDYDKCVAAGPAACAPCKFVTQGDTTSCSITVSIQETSDSNYCSFAPHRIYVLSPKSSAGNTSKYGGTVTLNISSDNNSNYKITTVTFKDSPPVWMSPTSPTDPYTLIIQPQQVAGAHNFYVGVTRVIDGTTCKTPDPVIGNGLY
jgi:uncharacterized repeat protein (TIGR01451 family)